MYVAVLAHLGGKVLIPDAAGIQDREDRTLIDFVDVEGRVLVTFRREDVAMHGVEDEIPVEAFGAK